MWDSKCPGLIFAATSTPIRFSPVSSPGFLGLRCCFASFSPKSYDVASSWRHYPPVALCLQNVLDFLSPVKTLEYISFCFSLILFIFPKVTTVYFYWLSYIKPCLSSNDFSWPIYTTKILWDWNLEKKFRILFIWHKRLSWFCFVLQWTVSTYSVYWNGSISDQHWFALSSAISIAL